jgi:predicted acyl esterase
VGRGKLAVSLCLALLDVVGAGSAHAALVTHDLWYTASDGVKLHATLGGAPSIAKRPLIVEDTPYGVLNGISVFAGSAYNYIELQWRGTGQSGGALSTTGSRDQTDLAEFLGWACQQPWSNGRIGLYGFSASSIVVYNSMHEHLPCVKAAALMSGTVDLYRDLLWIGGIQNSVPGAYVEGAIFGPWFADTPGRTEQQPVAGTPDGAAGYVTAPADVQAHLTEDSYWRDRTFRGDHDHIPVLADVGFYDVESRGAFLAYRATRRYGSHLLVIGAHDGWPVNTRSGPGGPFPYYAAWFDHYVRGVENGIDAQPSVSAYLSDGSRGNLLDGHWTHVDGSRWPLDGTSWTRLYLSPAASGTAHSINDGTLAAAPVSSQTVQTYPFAPSDATETDQHTVATVAGTGAGPLTLNNLAHALPALTNMQLTEPSSLTYTTAPLPRAINAVGPASLDGYASSTAPFTDLVAVLADVSPDGSAEPVAQGQLRTAYPYIERSRSLEDPEGDIVEPYPDFSGVTPALPGTTRRYHVEILPIGNHFAAGDRLRLYVVGTSVAMEAAPPAANSLSIGGTTPSKLLFPTLGATPST